MKRFYSCRLRFISPAFHNNMKCIKYKLITSIETYFFIEKINQQYWNSKELTINLISTVLQEVWIRFVTNYSSHINFQDAAISLFHILELKIWISDHAKLYMGTLQPKKIDPHNFGRALLIHQKKIRKLGSFLYQHHNMQFLPPS